MEVYFGSGSQSSLNKGTKMKFKLTPAVIHALCQSAVNCGTSCLSVSLRSKWDLIHSISEATDFREVSKQDIGEFIDAIFRKHIIIG